MAKTSAPTAARSHVNVLWPSFEVSIRVSHPPPDHRMICQRVHQSIRQFFVSPFGLSRPSSDIRLISLRPVCHRRSDGRGPLDRTPNNSKSDIWEIAAICMIVFLHANIPRSVVLRRKQEFSTEEILSYR